MEHGVYKELLKMVPGLEDRIVDPEELESVADHVSVFFPMVYNVFFIFLLLLGYPAT